MLLHPTSLPGPLGAGDLGPAAHAFVDWLQSARQRWWQLLPVGPPGRSFSPYDGASTMAGSPGLVSIEGLVEDGMLRRSELPHPAGGARADLRRSAVERRALLRLAFDRARSGPRRARRAGERFLSEESPWAADHALFEALRHAHGGRPWPTWPEGPRRRQTAALDAARRHLDAEVRFELFVQARFREDLRRLRSYAHRKGVALLGDVPLLPGLDSADVWALQDAYRLDDHGRPTVLAGAPPDDFDSRGQLWGHPLPRWDAHHALAFAPWRDRFRIALERFDAVRIDHFIGLHRLWEVPAGSMTAARGRFSGSPGTEILTWLCRDHGRTPLPLVAEDLGTLVPQVDSLRDAFGLPGMRVVQFAFGADPGSRRHRPDRYPHHVVAYTGTHDNDTLAGWVRRLERAAAHDSKARRTLARIDDRSGGGTDRAGALLRAVFDSRAWLVVTPVQDVLGLGSRARMNVPGRRRGCWSWRLQPGQLDASSAEHLAGLTSLSGRDGRAGR